MVEVADTRLSYHCRVKVPLDARRGVAEVWLVHPRRRESLIHRDPGSQGYQTTFSVRPGDILAPLAFPDRSFDVAALLGVRRWRGLPRTWPAWPPAAALVARRAADSRGCDVARLAGARQTGRGG